MKTKIIRDDIIGDFNVPKGIKDKIALVGGYNPHEEPLFRLLLAECRFTKASGEWNIWPEDATVDERGGLGLEEIRKMCMRGAAVQEINDFMQQKLSAHPTQVVEGLENVPLYNIEGWILEKWRPASTFGSSEDWYSYKFKGEIALGEFPYLGDYELVAGPTPYMPSAQQCADAIREHFHKLNERKIHPRDRLLQLANAQEAKRCKNLAKRKAIIDDYRREGPASLYNRISLEAGRVRNELAERAGIKEHMGN